MVKIGCKKTSLRKPIKKHLPKDHALDTMMTQIMRLRAGGTLTGAPCEYCGKWAEGRNSHNHHGIVHRTYKNTRWELGNCAHLCGKCHDYLGKFPRINIEWFKKRAGSDRVEQLEILARSGNRIDREAVKLNLQEKLKILEG